MVAADFQPVHLPRTASTSLAVGRGGRGALTISSSLNSRPHVEPAVLLLVLWQIAGTSRRGRIP